MKKIARLPIPAIRALKKLGNDISQARRRRRISIALIAERADLSRGTLGKIEKGDPSVSIGGYASILFTLGMSDRLSDLIDSAHDTIGQELDIENLPKRIRLPQKQPKEKNNE